MQTDVSFIHLALVGDDAVDDASIGNTSPGTNTVRFGCIRIDRYRYSDLY